MPAKLKSLLVLLYQLFIFIVCYGIFAVLMAFAVPFVLTRSRTALIVAMSFTVSYGMLSRIYGAMDIGSRKSRSIVFSMMMILLFSDLIAHLFLSIMDITIVHGGHFVYEAPVLLVVAYMVQVIFVICGAFIGNDVFFAIFRPLKCILIHAPDADTDSFVAKIETMNRQYQITRTMPFAADNLNKIVNAIDKSDAVFIYGLPVAERSEIVSCAYRAKKDIYYNLEVDDIVSAGGEMRSLVDTPVIYSPVKNNDLVYRFIKKIADLILSLIGIIALIPMFIIVSAAIKIEDGGSVFYKQPRITIGGKTFKLIKFRSMREEVGDIHVSVTENDERITKVGRFIRKFRIDEFPQLFNVLAGDMSLVGPRPEMVENVKAYSRDLPEFLYRQRMKAGITGLAQVYGRYNTSPKDKLMYDLMYIEQANIWLDIKLILRTVLVLFTPEESTQAFKK